MLGRKCWKLIGFWALLATGSLAACGAAAESDSESNAVVRGRYLIHAGGCISCHTADEDDAPPLAGGHALETPFGTFFTPNITPDVETGIGSWSDDDFLNALRQGVSPEGSSYYPSFPYTSYTGLTKDDVLAMKAYLFSLEPVVNPNKKNELSWYVSMRMAASAWKRMNFRPRRYAGDTSQSTEWNRGAYLVRHLGHCGECHTPRTKTGKILYERELAGNPAGADGEKIPNITPDKEAGIGRWSEREIELFLEMGMLPDGDFTGGSMSPVIDDNTSQLTDEDRRAIGVYLKSVTPSSETAGAEAPK